MKKSVLFTLFLAVWIPNAYSSSPAFLWNLKSNLPSALNSDEFVQRIAAFQKTPLAIFIQDELSVEDFSVHKASLPNIRQLTKTFENKMVFIPALDNSINLVHSLKEEGYQIVTLKENMKVVPEALSDNVAYVLRLPETATEASRTDALKNNDKIIRTMFDALQTKFPNVIGIFVGKQNPMDLLGSKRIARSLLATKEGFPGELYNASGQIFMFVENQPQVLVYQDKQSISNFTLASPTSVSGTSNGSYASLSLTYGEVSFNATTSLSRTRLDLHFLMHRGKWSISNATLDFSAQVNGTSYANSVALKPIDVTTPRGFSYHCSRRQLLAPAAADKTGAWAKFELRGVQLQPFHITKDRFGDWYDCEGFFSVGIWAGILLGLMIASILAWGVSMLTDIKTPDRFDDPKGKAITINASE